MPAFEKKNPKAGKGKYFVFGMATALIVSAIGISTSCYINYKNDQKTSQSVKPSSSLQKKPRSNFTDNPLVHDFDVGGDLFSTEGVIDCEDGEQSAFLFDPINSPNKLTLEYLNKKLNALSMANIDYSTASDRYDDYFYFKLEPIAYKWVIHLLNNYNNYKAPVATYYSIRTGGPIEEVALAEPDDFITNDDQSIIGIRVYSLMVTMFGDPDYYLYDISFGMAVNGMDTAPAGFESIFNKGYVNSPVKITAALESPNLIKDGEVKDVYVELGTPVTTDWVLSQVSAVDLFGANLPVKLESSALDNPNFNYRELGVYPIKVSSTYAEILSRATINVHLVDTTAPTWTVKDPDFKPEVTIGKEYSEGELLEYFLGDYLTAEDISGINYELYYLDSSVANFTRIVDDGPNYFEVKGNFTWRIIATDLSGNSSTKEFKVDHKDKTAPVLSLKAEYAGSEFLTFGYSQHVSVKTIATYFEAYDSIDGKLEVKIADFKKDQIGEQIINVYASDTSGNVAEMSYRIKIEMDTTSVFFVISNKLIASSASNPLTEDSLKMYVAFANEVNPADVLGVEILNMDYLKGNLNKPGDYTVNYTLKTSTGINKTDSISLVVKGDKPYTPNIWERFVAWWKTTPPYKFFREVGKVCNHIGDFFKHFGRWGQIK